MNKLCVIIPVYNSEKTLEALLNCFTDHLCDTFNLIIVDDASTDNSAAILESYASLHSPFVIFVKLDSNISTGAVRNMALSLLPDDCTHVGFCDSDDLYKVDVAIKLMNEMSDANASLSTGSYILKTDRDGYKETCYRPCDNGSNKFRAKSVSVWSGIYDVQFLKKYDIKFFDSYSGEDLAFTWICLGLAGDIYKTDEIIYEYDLCDHVRYHSGSRCMNIDLYFNICNFVFNKIKNSCTEETLVHFKYVIMRHVADYYVDRFLNENRVALINKFVNIMEKIDFEILSKSDTRSNLLSSQTLLETVLLMNGGR